MSNVTAVPAIVEALHASVPSGVETLLDLARKPVWTIRDAATVSRTLRRIDLAQDDWDTAQYLGVAEALENDDELAGLRDYLESALADYRKVLNLSKGSNLPDAAPARPVAEPVTHYVKAREPGKRNFVFVTSNGESRLKVHAARFTLTSALAAIAELACENPGWQFKAVRIDGAKYGTFTTPIIPHPSPVSFTTPSVKAAAMAPEAAPDTYTPIRPVAEPSSNLVYDVLEHVKPGTMTSTTPGTWLVQHFATEDQAREFAARCNQCAGVAGITFEVQAIDAESPDRHQSEADYHRSQRPSIGPAPISGGSPESAPATPENAGHTETGPKDLRFEEGARIVAEVVEWAREAPCSITRDSRIERYYGTLSTAWRFSVEVAMSRGMGLEWMGRNGSFYHRFKAMVLDCIAGSPVSFPDPAQDGRTAGRQDVDPSPGFPESASVAEPTIIRDGKGRIITRIATHDEATIGDVLSVPGGFDRITAKRTREDGRIEYTTANQGAIAIHPSNDVELAEVLADPSPVSGGSPELAVDLSPGFPESATLPTVWIKGAAYTTEALPNGLAFIKLVNGNRHEVTWTEGGVADCSCPAFYHTGSCKHADYALKAGLIPTPPALPEPPATLPEPAPSDPCDIRPGHPEYTIEDEHARVRAIIDGAPILVYRLPESGPGRVDTLGWVVADHVSRLLEIQRDGHHGRDDSAGVGWTASLLWDAMPAEEREHFAEWVDAIGYDPTEDFAGLPADEQWDVFAECCTTGTPIRTIPPGSDPGPGADATTFGDQSRDFVASVATPAPSPEIFFGCNASDGHDLRPSPCPPPEVFASDPIISRAPWDAIDLIGAHAMNTLPALSGGSDEASPGPKHATPGSIVLFWHCPACRKSGPIGAALPAARPEVSARAIQDHRTDSPDCPGVPDVGFPAWMPEDGTPGTIYLPVGGGSPELPEDYPCPECGGSGVAGGQFTEGGEETSPCTLCEGTGRYSPTELPEEEYDRLVAAITPSNETLRRMIRDRKPPEANDTLLDDLERLARQMQGDRPTQFEDSVALALREAAEEIRRLQASQKLLVEAAENALHVLTPARPVMDGLDRTRMWLRESIKAAEPDWVEPDPKP